MSEPGQPNASVLKLCFWEAVKRCAQDEDSDLKLVPCGPDDPGGINFGTRMPEKFFAHMAAAYAELREAAGV